MASQSLAIDGSIRDTTVDALRLEIEEQTNTPGTSLRHSCQDMPILEFGNPARFLLCFNLDCSAMHNIPNPYPSFCLSGHMADPTENIIRIDAQLLKKTFTMCGETFR